MFNLFLWALIIAVIKFIEMALEAVNIVFINMNEYRKVFWCSFVGMILYLLIISRVFLDILNIGSIKNIYDILSYCINLISYSIGYATGMSFGTWFGNYLKRRLIKK